MSRKTKFEERKEIVDYCINHNRNYKEMVCVEKCLHFQRKCRHHLHPISDILPVFYNTELGFQPFIFPFKIAVNIRSFTPG